jgi:predicted Fe-Mo cluster-binding NifX family protein
MKAAFTIWRDRIAPVFDVAREVVLVEADSNTQVASSLISLPEGAVETKVNRLCEQGVNVLVCGAMSRCAHELVCAEKIEVFSFVAGDTDSVIQAWLEGCLEQKAFAMPGCDHGRQQCCRHRGGTKNK